MPQRRVTSAADTGGGAAEAALFAAVMSAFGPVRPPSVAVAVSGGGDSMALLALMAELPGWRVQAVTVDHGLRPEAQAEAALVAQYCAAHGLGHTVLRWVRDAEGSGNLMQAARQARLDLIGAWAQAQGITHVALAHTAQDQAETLLMGLSRAAGLDGLAGMRPAWVQAGVTWLRPLLGATRQDLRDVLVRRGVAWAEDPTNQNDQYLRARARKALVPLAGLGIPVAALARSAGNLAAMRGVLDRMTNTAATALVEERAGALRLRPDQPMPDPEILRRLVLRAVGWLTGSAHGPRAAALDRLTQSVLAGRAATLAGVRLVQSPGGLWLCREGRSAGEAVAAGALWDGRWRITGPLPTGATVAALGAAGLAAVADWRSTGLPRPVALMTPGIWHEGRLISAPILGFGTDCGAEVVAPFHLGNIAH